MGDRLPDPAGAAVRLFDGAAASGRRRPRGEPGRSWQRSPSAGWRCARWPRALRARLAAAGVAVAGGDSPDHSRRDRRQRTALVRSPRRCRRGASTSAPSGRRRCRRAPRGCASRSTSASTETAHRSLRCGACRRSSGSDIRAPRCLRNRHRHGCRQDRRVARRSCAATAPCRSAPLLEADSDRHRAGRRHGDSGAAGAAAAPARSCS